MNKAPLSSPSGPPHSTSHQGQPNARQHDDNQLVFPQRIRKIDRFMNMFRSSSQKRKAKNSQITNSKSTVKDDLTARAKESTHRPSTVISPGSVGINLVVPTTDVKSTPSDVHSPFPPARSRLDVFTQNVRAPTMRITLPKSGARIETSAQLALCMGLLSKAGGSVDQRDDPFQDMSPDTPAHLAYIQAMKQDPTERERTLWLGTRMVEEFAKDAFKDSTEVAEMVLIGPVLDKEHFRGLLSCMITAFDQSAILN
ncbi:hypothetical protein BGZ97_009565, partial [Linnemannia gamsii]